MFDNFDFSKMTQMLEAAQEQAKKLEADSASKEYSVKAGGGMVCVRANGKGEVVDINIDDSLLDDKESLQILLISAVNDAIKMADDDKKSMAASMLSGLSGFGGMK
ncbi:YbaB/EbfC family nucleoid-associated protein [Campylobacter sp. 19-13652]|uniref:YbaB/EbfC family nucleoid-associated protein n=1 Tax=Campylobacter sp. 19-13652 TaxID=2840180 RepID=UPI001C74AB6C|nr:YbaB/EbfC family nucleoid-associated protein [Campylobacter sp. 19-13652]BCX78721.1 nucleoid-associated protein [Campylobacter sp. 19-13652]